MSWTLALVLAVGIVFYGPGLLVLHPNRPTAHAQTFTTSGTWTVPAGTTYAKMEAWGGGGSGGGTTANSAGGSGAAGGQYAIKTIAVTPGNNYTVTVATTTAGSSGASGSAGGDSSVVSPTSTTVVLAKGGAAGTLNQSTPGVGSTTGGIGDTIFAGGSGGTTVGITSRSGGGGGGAGSTGAGGSASSTSPTAGTGTALNGGNGGTGLTANGIGNAGSNYGGGGSGAYKTNGGNKAGGSGAQGLVVITPYTDTILNQGGQTKLFFHKEASDISPYFDSLSQSPPEAAADTFTPNAATTVDASPPTLTCVDQSGFGTGYHRDNGLAASASNTGEICIDTFYSSPIGQAINFTTSDTASITGQFWTQEGVSGITGTTKLYIFANSDTAAIQSAGTLIATLSCPDPGTSVTSCTPTAVAPTNNVLIPAGSRIAVIVSVNITATSASQNFIFYIDSTARAAVYLKFGYTFSANASSNKPALSGSMDDDFTTDAAATTCTTGGVAYHTKWTCLQGSAASTTGAFNAGGTSSPTGDSSSWLWLSNQTTATSATTCDFNANSGGSCATPSNTFLYQAMPSGYGNGNFTTAMSAPYLYDIGTGTASGTPYTHSGLVLWTSNSDYLELQVYSTSDDGTAVNVALNNSGTLSGATILSTYESIWLRFINTANSWQAQYSTDGTSFTNLGSAVSHATAFSRVGLNAYAAIANPVMSYAGAFEWFSSTITGTANSPPNAPTLSSPINGGTVTTSVPQLKMSATDPDTDSVKYKLFIYNTAVTSGGNCSGSLLTTADQTSSGTGWDNGTTAYSSGVTATYTVQSALTFGNSYCWQSQAIDPTGSNTFGSLSSAFTFSVIPDTSQFMRGGRFFDNGSEQSYYWAR